MKLAPDFWQSKSTWNALAGIVSAIFTQVFHREDLLPLVVAIFGFLQAMFLRDAVAKKPGGG